MCAASEAHLDHPEVVSLFHEFGHLLHHVLAGGQLWHGLARPPVEMDFVETPPQVFEQWAWDHATLASFTPAGIPVELVDRMRLARDVFRHTKVRGRLFYAAMAFELHRREISGIEHMDEIVEAAADRYEPLGLVPKTHIHTGFLHLRAYGAAVYAHLWGTALAADLGRVVSPTAGRPGGGREFAAVLAEGAGRPAQDLVTSLLARRDIFEVAGGWEIRSL